MADFRKLPAWSKGCTLHFGTLPYWSKEYIRLQYTVIQTGERDAIHTDTVWSRTAEIECYNKVHVNRLYNTLGNTDIGWSKEDNVRMPPSQLQPPLPPLPPTIGLIAQPRALLPPFPSLFQEKLLQFLSLYVESMNVF